MSTLDYLYRIVLPAAYALLPDRLRSDQASALLLAIALQESRAQTRRQFAEGPARGFWQFERSGVAGVLTHDVTKPLIMPIVNTLQYPGLAPTCHVAIEHHDILAAVFARLLLWTSPRRLPTREEPDLGWLEYLACWRPGKPHPTTWLSNFAQAWAIVTERESNGVDTPTGS